MIYDASTWPTSVTLHADLCVIGSGAGGAAAAMAAAEAGLRTVLLEAGPYLTPAHMTQREEQMFPRLLCESGARATADGSLRLIQGKGVGGSTLHNLNLIKRIPDAILRHWDTTRGMTGLGSAQWATLYNQAEALLGTAPVPMQMVNLHNRLLQRGCEALGWRGGMMRHNRSGCVGSGFCEVGCAYDAKNNACKVLVPRLIAAGGEVVSNCRADRVEMNGRRAVGVVATAMDPQSGRPRGTVRVSARQICVSASATGTAALLLRSGVPHPDGSIGQTLHTHPAVVAVGEFDEPVRAWEGIPQAYECTQFLDMEAALAGSPRSRLWIVNAFAHPMGASGMLPGMGTEHAAIMQRYPHMAVLTAMLHDHTCGSVAPKGEAGLSVSYNLLPEDSTELHFGLKACARILLAAGARRVIIPSDPMILINSPAQVDLIDTISLATGRVDLTAVHPMGTTPMGDDPRTAAFSPMGRCWSVDGLWVADGSLFPTSIGVPPQLSIYAMGLHVGRAIADAAARTADL